MRGTAEEYWHPQNNRNNAEQFCIDYQVELHLHLDGSLSPDFIARQAAKRGISLPCKPGEQSPL